MEQFPASKTAPAKSAPSPPAGPGQNPAALDTDSIKAFAKEILISSDAFRKAKLYSALSSKLIEQEAALIRSSSGDREKTYRFAIEGLSFLADQSLGKLSDTPWGESPSRSIVGSYRPQPTKTERPLRRPVCEGDVEVQDVLTIKPPPSKAEAPNSQDAGVANVYHVDSLLGEYAWFGGVYVPHADRIYIIDNSVRSFRSYSYAKARERLEKKGRFLSATCPHRILLGHEEAHRRFDKETGPDVSLKYLANRLEFNGQGADALSPSHLLAGVNELHSFTGEALADPYGFAYGIIWGLRHPQAQHLPHRIAFEHLLPYIAKPQGPLKWLSAFHDSFSSSARRMTARLDAVISLLKTPWKKVEGAAASRKYGRNYPLRAVLRLAAMASASLSAPFQIVKFALFVSNTALNAAVHVLVLEKRVKRIYDPHKVWTVERLAKRFIKNKERLQALEASLGLLAFEKEFKCDGFAEKFKAQRDELARVQPDSVLVRRLLERAAILDSKTRQLLSGIGLRAAESIAQSIGEALESMKNTSERFSKLLEKYAGKA